MGSLLLISKILYKKADTYTSMGFSLIIILMQNPYAIWDIGLQLSYLATLGILFFYKDIFQFLYNEKRHKFKYIKESIALSISAQIFIIPILSSIFHKFSIHFIISNMLATPLFAIAVFLGVITLIIGSIFNMLGELLSIILNIDIQGLLIVSDLMSINEWGILTVSRPSYLLCVIYYLFFILLKIIHNINSRKEIWKYLNLIQRKEIQIVKNLYKKRKTIFKILIFNVIIFILLDLLFNSFSNNLEIHFIDVGQGDCTLIQTQSNKKILIDGGGSMDNSYDVGEKIVVPYLLNHNIQEIDFLIVSHFDTDHYQGCAKVMEKLKVNNIIICKQENNSENYEEFKKIVKQKKSKVIIVKKRRCDKHR